MTVVPAVLPRTRRAYDHRLREQVVRCGAKVVASHVQIPRSTASTWRRRGLRPVVTTEPFDQEKQHALDSSVRWQKRARAFAAVVRLLLALLRASGFSLTGMRLPEGQAKAGILRAVTSAESFLPLAIILRILELESGRYHAWRRAETVCELTDRSSCPRTGLANSPPPKWPNARRGVLRLRRPCRRSTCPAPSRGQTGAIGGQSDLGLCPVPNRRPAARSLSDFRCAALAPGKVPDVLIRSCAGR